MAQLSAADDRRATLGSVLVRVGIITPDQLEEALRECGPNPKSLPQVLVALGFTTEEKIFKAVSMQQGIPYFTSFEGVLRLEAAKLVPESMARKYLVVPLFQSDGCLTLGMIDPLDIYAIDTVSNHTGLRVKPVMTTLPNLFEAVQQLYAGKSVAESASPQLAVLEAKDQVIRFQAQEKSVVDVVDSMLQEAMARKASDIHLEPAEKELRVRFRVDGMLQPGKSFSKDMEATVIARVKILAKLNITETRLPQDGHIGFDYGGRKIDLRVSTLPIIWGEKVVLRILDSSQALKKLPDLGLAPAILDSFRAVIQRPNGLVLVTGPTGSGKTTTLYAAIAERNEPNRNIVTLEDPVEYHIDRINQMETNAKIGLTFAVGLRSILRQDPNIILVGEIRDAETAEIAIQASITGHIVFSTLHTSDAVAAVHRLLNMGVEPFLIAAALNGVMAQRLVRRLCERCKRKHAITSLEAQVLGDAAKSGKSFFEAQGCDVCLKSGYTGRFAIHEWLAVSPAIRELILRKASLDDLRAKAKSEKMKSLRDDALVKAEAGATSLEEVIRVTHEEVAG